MSLRELSAKSGIEYTRISRMEHGTRPAPGLHHMRRLAELLSLNLVDLLVSAGTPREAVEQLLWVERLRQGAQQETLAEYTPQGHRAGLKNEFIAEVLQRDGALCRAQVGSETWTLVSFSHAARLKVRVPPEAVQIFVSDPRDILSLPDNVFQSRVVKVRRIGSLLNVILSVGDVEINALVATQPAMRNKPAPGDAVYVVVPPAALSTAPQEAVKEAV
jgi:transcriptional regulator with XRE-family HTH domain